MGLHILGKNLWFSILKQNFVETELLSPPPFHITLGLLEKVMKSIDLFKLNGKVAIVTGGGSGLGRAMAMALSEAGAAVAVVDVNEETAQKVKDEISVSGGSSLAIKADVTSISEVNSMVEITVKEYGSLDILVNSAGTSHASLIEKMTLEIWDEVMKVNLTGVMLCCQAAVKQMMRQRRGKIINIASIAGMVIPKPKIFNGGYNYSASKAGVIIFTKRLAVEMAEYGITANCISPGYMRTPLTQKVLKDKKSYKEIINITPLRRLGEPSDLAGAVVFLASEASNFITGHNLVVDGGYTLW
ncbi:short-chain dehydrogenase [Candidatus Aerophobetes bacterium]|uniref:Short-chain dehydrogenase n=1 Tax=Aerophobetes bacterium TaxID=2030807 RepID=A0A662DJT5_UNCAE|nr:MAG: short-chain dehydrogenase [Candidatus Aerophobetes bacterium]